MATSFLTLPPVRLLVAASVAVVSLALTPTMGHAEPDPSTTGTEQTAADQAAQAPQTSAGTHVGGVVSFSDVEGGDSTTCS